MAFIEWVDLPVAVGAPVVEDTAVEEVAPAAPEVVEAEVVKEAKPKKPRASKAKKTEE